MSNTSQIGGLVLPFHLREDFEVRFNFSTDLNPQRARRLSMRLQSPSFMAERDVA